MTPAWRIKPDSVANAMVNPPSGFLHVSSTMADVLFAVALKTGEEIRHDMQKLWIIQAFPYVYCMCEYELNVTQLPVCRLPAACVCVCVWERKRGKLYECKSCDYALKCVAESSTGMQMLKPACSGPGWRISRSAGDCHCPAWLSVRLFVCLE